MWCKTCRQDGPSIASSAGVGHVCARCGATVLSAGKACSGTHVFDGSLLQRAAVIAPPAIDPLANLDTWECDETLRHAARILECGRLDSATAERASELTGMDPRHELPTGFHWPGMSQSESRSPEHKIRNRIVSRVAWAMLSLGLATLVCGAALTGWSLVVQRAELWDVGVPIALMGQVGLLLGLILQLEGLAQDSRRQEERLKQVDHQIIDLTDSPQIDLSGQTHQVSAAPDPVLTGPARSENIRPQFTSRQGSER